jgi:hypothetical protein
MIGAAVHDPFRAWRAILSRDPELTLMPRSPPPAFSSILMASLQSASASKPARIDVNTATKSALSMRHWYLPWTQSQQRD